MKPIIIIGAARSGTNMLRDILTSLPDMGTWDCDEINPIWKHYNLKYKYDDIPETMANSKTKKFIRKKFNEIAKKISKNNIVEKTCANSLRLPFVNSIFPEAKYLIIIRNGYDASISANVRWSSKLEFIYTLKKLRYVPFTDIPFYAWHFGKNRLEQLINKDRLLKIWGPIFPELEEFSRKHTALEVSAYQWSKSVNQTLKALKEIDPSRYHIITYESFTSNPTTELKAILGFLKYSYHNQDLVALTRNVSTKSVGSAKRKLSKTEYNMISPFVDPTMKKIKNL